MPAIIVAPDRHFTQQHGLMDPKAPANNKRNALPLHPHNIGLQSLPLDVIPVHRQAAHTNWAFEYRLQFFKTCKITSLLIF